MARYKFPTTVEQAAKILDSANPEWFNKVDVDRILPSYAWGCVIGQSFGCAGNESFEQVMFGLFGKKYKDNADEDNVFDCDFFVNEWRAEIMKRRPAMVKAIPPEDDDEDIAIFSRLAAKPVSVHERVLKLLVTQGIVKQSVVEAAIALVEVS